MTNTILLIQTIHRQEQQRSKQQQTIADVAEATAHVLAKRLFSLAKEAEIIADEVAHSHGDLVSIEARLHHAVVVSGHHYILGDRNISQLINTTAPPDIDRPATREPGELASIFAGRELIITEPRESRFVGVWSNGQFRPDHFFGVRVPVRINGEIRYVLTLLAQPAVMKDVLADTYRPPAWGATVVDQKGRRVVRIPEDGSLIGKQGPAKALDRSPFVPRGIVELIDAHGRPATAAMTPIPKTPWRVAVWAHHEVLAQESSMSEAWIAFVNLLLLAGLLGALRHSVPVEETVSGR